MALTLPCSRGLSTSLTGPATGQSSSIGPCPSSRNCSQSTSSRSCRKRCVTQTSNSTRNPRACRCSTVKQASYSSKTRCRGHDECLGKGFVVCWLTIWTRRGSSGGERGWLGLGGRRGRRLVLCSCNSRMARHMTQTISSAPMAHRPSYASYYSMGMKLRVCSCRGSCLPRPLCSTAMRPRSKRS